jgi:hypothetical protein
VILGKRSTIGEVPVSVVERNKVHTNMCVIMNGYRYRAVRIFVCGGWMDSEVCEGDQLICSTLDAVACIKKCEDQLRRATGNLHTRLAKCFEVNGRDFGTFIVNCNKFVIYD